jgi:hypothetical protein
MDEFDYQDGSSNAFDLISSLANNATQAYETSQALNANPLNTALVYGGAASTPYGSSVGGFAGAPSPAMGGSSILLFLLAAGVIVYAVSR